MIGTLCFIADFDTENYLNEFKLEASEKYHVGVTGGNVPRHISLGMPYEMKSLRFRRDYFQRKIDRFAEYFNSRGIHTLVGTREKE